MKLPDDKGSMTMEFIMVMPLLLLLIFGILQLSLVIIAKQMTQYAAYCAARAAIVYNPADYSTGPKSFHAAKGPVFKAAAEALRPFGMLTFDPVTKVPDQNYIYKQVRIVNGDENLPDEEKFGVSEDLWETEQTPAVKVIVSFNYPMLIPYAAHFIDYFNRSGASRSWQLHGFAPDDLASFSQHAKAVPTFTLIESCIMHRPWNTKTFPHVPPQDME